MCKIVKIANISVTIFRFFSGSLLDIRILNLYTVKFSLIVWGLKPNKGFIRVQQYALYTTS